MKLPPLAKWRTTTYHGMWSEKTYGNVYLHRNVYKYGSTQGKVLLEIGDVTIGKYESGGAARATAQAYLDINPGAFRTKDRVHIKMHGGPVMSPFYRGTDSKGRHRYRLSVPPGMKASQVAHEIKAAMLAGESITVLDPATGKRYNLGKNVYSIGVKPVDTSKNTQEFRIYPESDWYKKKYGKGK